MAERYTALSSQDRPHRRLRIRRPQVERTGWSVPLPSSRKPCHIGGIDGRYVVRPDDMQSAVACNKVAELCNRQSHWPRLRVIEDLHEKISPPPVERDDPSLRSMRKGECFQRRHPYRSATTSQCHPPRKRRTEAGSGKPTGTTGHTDQIESTGGNFRLLQHLGHHGRKALHMPACHRHAAARKKGITPQEGSGAMAQTGIDTENEHQVGTGRTSSTSGM